LEHVCSIFRSFFSKFGDIENRDFVFLLDLLDLFSPDRKEFLTFFIEQKIEKKTKIKISWNNYLI